MSTPEWAPIASWICGWFNLVGNWTVTLSINFGGAQLILSAISLWQEDFAPTAWQTVLCFWAIMLVCFLINAFGSKYLDFINKLCIYWTGASVIIVDNGVDSGPIVAQERVPVLRGDDEHSLQDRIKPVERRLLIDVVRRIATGDLDLAAVAAATGAPS